MKRYKPFVLLALVPALAVSSCYHETFGGGTGGGGGIGGGGGTGTVIVTVTSTPSPTFYFPYLAWEISSIVLLTSSGTAAPVLQAPLPITDFARLQSDSQLLNTNGKAVSIAAGTYTSAKISLSPSTNPSYIYNSNTINLFSNTNTPCLPGTVCQIPNTVPGFGTATVTVPVSFTLAGNQSTGFSLNFDLSKAVTTAGTASITFDFTQTGAITLTTLPRAGQTTGLDSLQNFTGMITATTGTTISISSISSDTVTFTVPSTGVEFDDPFNVCGTGQANFNCLKTNQNVSVDATVNSDGTLTAYEIDFLDPAPGANEIEGIIVTPLSNSQFKIVITNGMGAAGLLPGTLATVTLNNASTVTYLVDPKNLGISTTASPGFQSSTDLVMGQSVMLKGATTNFATNGLSNYSQTLLRYSSIGGTVQTVGTPIFTLSAVPAFFTSLTTNTVQVETFTTTTFDNITGGLGGLSGGTNVSVRGLYLNPTSGATSPVLAAQVRAH